MIISFYHFAVGTTFNDVKKNHREVSLFSKVIHFDVDLRGKKSDFKYTKCSFRIIRIHTSFSPFLANVAQHVRTSPSQL
jgi:hypothetical protein